LRQVGRVSNQPVALDQAHDVAGAPLRAEPRAERGPDHPQPRPPLTRHSSRASATVVGIVQEPPQELPLPGQSMGQRFPPAVTAADRQWPDGQESV
jgi:hypothetical protein